MSFYLYKSNLLKISRLFSNFKILICSLKMKFYNTLSYMFIFLLFTKSYTYSQVFNELGVAPTSSDGSLVGYSTSASGTGQGEWIELYNPTCNAIDLSGYIIGTYNAWDGRGMSLIIPNGKSIAPNGFAIVRGIKKTAPGAGITDIEINEANASTFCVDFPNAMSGETRMWFQNGGAWMALYDKNGVPKDMVKWGNLSDPNDLSGNPCVPAGSSLPGSTTLASYNTYGTGNSIATPVTMGKTLVRLPDGGTWSSTLVNENSSYGSSNQPITATLNYGTPFCTEQSPVSPGLTGTGSYSGGTYSCSNAALIINATTGQITLSSSTQGTYTVRYTKVGLPCPGYVEQQIIIKNPTVSANLVQNNTCSSGTLLNNGSISYAVTDGVGAITYNTDGGTTYSLTAASPITNLSNGNYTIKIKDSRNCTASATLIAVNGACSPTCTNPIISAHPGAATKCEGGDNTFSVTASGTTLTSLTYQWQEDPGTGTFTNITGATSSTYAKNNVTTAINGYKYQCIVTETTNGGCSITSNPAILTVDSKPTATSTGSTTICLAGTAVVSGVSTSNVTATGYSWSEDGDGSITAGANTLTPTYTPDIKDTTKTITLTMVSTSANSCPNPANVTYSVKVDPLPIAKAGGTTSICASGTALVSGAFAYNGSILWTHNGQGSISAGATTLTPTYTPGTGDAGNTVTLKMTVTSDNKCGLPTTNPAKEATETYTVKVTSTSNPTAVAGGPSKVCAKKAITLAGASSTNGSNLWTIVSGNGTLTNETTLTPTYTSVLADTIADVELKLTVSPGTGCTGSAANSIHKITVNKLPKVIPSATKGCIGTDATLDGNTVSSASYTWTGPNAYSQLTKTATISNITPADTGLYELKIKDINGCVDSTKVRVSLYPLPTIVGDTFACVGTSVTLSASNSIATSWVSQIPANLTIDPATGVATGVKGGVTKVEFTDANGCKDDQLILTEDLPVVDFTVDSTSICIGNDVKFTDKSPIKNTNIIWDFGDGVQTNDIDPAYTYQKVDSFTVSLTSISPNLCEGKLTKTKYITPIDVPTMKFGFTPDSIDNFNPEIQFINYSTAKFFTWNFGDYSPVSYEKNPLHTFPETPGQAYKVTLKGSNSLSGVCPISVYQEIVSLDPAIYFIPNSFTPNGDEINNTFQPIFTSGYDPQNYSFWIYNRLGELVFETHNAAIGWDGTFGGKLAENNTYVWKLQFKSKQTEKEFYLTGHVNLVK